METDGKAPLRVDDVVADGRKLIVAFELQARLAKRQPSAMEEAEIAPDSRRARSERSRRSLELATS